jgi:hypothetical protein
MGIGVKGQFYDELTGEKDPGVEVTDLPVHMDEHQEGFQSFISTYALDTAFSSYLELNEISGWVFSKDT